MLIFWLVAVTGGFTAANKAFAGNIIRLKSQAVVTQVDVTLGMIADLDGKYAKSFSQLVIGQFLKTSQSRSMSMTEVRSRLISKQVNLGKMTLCGFTRCQLNRVGKKNQSLRSQIKNKLPAVETLELGSPVMVNPKHAIELGMPVTLEARLIQYFQKKTGIAATNLVVKFDKRYAKKLHVSALEDDLEIEVKSTAKLGRIPVTIRRWRNGEFIGRLHVVVDVAHRTLAVVTKHTIRKGQVISASDLQVREVLLTKDSSSLVQKINQLIGKQSLRLIHENAVVYDDFFVAPNYVHRGDMIIVRYMAGSLVIRTQARALEAGALDDMIMVRNENSRENFIAKIVGPREVVITTSYQMPVGEKPTVRSTKVVQKGASL